MPTPLVVNVNPADGTVAPVGASYRFSVRDTVGEINRSSLQVYLGSGASFYRGGVLPEEMDPPPTIVFQALSGSPGVPATRTITMDGYLQIDKSAPSQNQEAVYFLGGLEAPAEPTDPLMVEFTLRLDKTQVTLDGDDYTGVMVGLLINNSGMTVKFTSTGFEFHTAELSGMTWVSSTSFDWDVLSGLNPDGSNTYKLLWYPEPDLVKFYVKDPTAATDQLLATAAVTDFATVPAPEQRDHQPWLFFGHGNFPDALSISKWKDVFLFNLVSNPLVDGIARGEHKTYVLTNNQVVFDGATLPRDAQRPWLILPNSFGPIGGSELVTPDGLVLERYDTSKSFGFYRREPKVTLPTILDFKASVVVRSQESSIETSGAEFYIDDGIRQARFAFLQDADGTQYVGVLKSGGDPTVLASYETVVVGFSTERDYRMILTPGVGVEVSFLTAETGGVLEDPKISVPYTNLPLTGMPGPGLGFLHNAGAGESLSAMTVRQVRYSTDVKVTDWTDFVSATPTWTIVGSGEVRPGTDNPEVNRGGNASITEALGVVTVTGLSGMSDQSVGNYLEVLSGDNQGIWLITDYISSSSVKIDCPSASGADSGNPLIQWQEIRNPEFARLSDQSVTDNMILRKEYLTGLQSDNGWSLEFRARVVSYEVDQDISEFNASGVNPLRCSTGVTVRVLDGTNELALVFAEAGPPYGKIVFLSLSGSSTQVDDLQAIRSGKLSAAGSYISVDWTKFHLYRIERTVGGRLRVFLDEDSFPEIDFEERVFPYPPHPGGNPRVELLHQQDGIQSVSDWQLVKFSMSDGFDLDFKPVLTEEELLTRFNHGNNVIVEAENT